MNRHGSLAWIRSSSARVPTYFASIVAVIFLVNTPIPRLVIGALLGQGVGTELGQSLQRSSRDLFLLLLISIYFEWAKGREQHEIYRRIEQRFDKLLDQSANLSPGDVRRTVIETADREELTRAALRRGLRIDTPSNRLVNLVASNRPVYHDVSIAITLDSRPSSLIGIRYDTRLTANLTDLLIGTTKTSAQAAVVSSKCVDLFEVLALPHRATLQDPAAAVNSLIDIYVIGETATNRLIFEHISETEKRQILGDLVALPYDDVEIVRAINFPAKEGQTRLQVGYEFTCNTDEHYCYWMADRPMYVHQISVDARSLDIDENVMDLHSFVGMLRDVSYARRQSKVFSITLDDWVLEGHGVAFVW